MTSLIFLVHSLKIIYELKDLIIFTGLAGEIEWNLRIFALKSF